MQTSSTTTAAAAQLSDIFGDCISSYSRAQALEDGILISLSDDPEGAALCNEAGVKWPAAITRAAWAETLARGCAWSGNIVLDMPAGQSYPGRVWDMLWMMRVAIKWSQGGGSEIKFSVLIRGGGPEHRQDLKAVCGPGDDFEPVITIMLPHED